MAATEAQARDPWTRSDAELRARLTRAASIYALQPTRFNRDVLARAMRRAIRAGIPYGEVRALAVLTGAEAQELAGAR